VTAAPQWVHHTWSRVWDPGARVVLVLVVAVVVRLVVHRLIARWAQRSARSTPRGAPDRVLGSRFAAQVLVEGSVLSGERRRQRVQTIASVGRSVTSLVVFFLAGLMILSELGLDIAPVLTSAGVLGVALGFGAQNLVKDFLSGIAILLEDQFGVGDVVDVGPVIGVVEGVALRTTQIRDVTGALWFVRNGEILRVANRSQGWARVLLDVEVAPDADLDSAKRVLVDAAVALAAEPGWAESVTEPPTSWGVESVSGDRAVIRLVLVTTPEKKDDVARELRRRIGPALHDAGVELPAPGASALTRLAAPRP